MLVVKKFVTSAHTDLIDSLIIGLSFRQPLSSVDVSVGMCLCVCVCVCVSVCNFDAGKNC